MKKISFLKSFLAIAGMFVVPSAWADTTVIGETDNTTGYWQTGFSSEAYLIEPNQTRTFQFVNHSSKANAYNGWYTLLSSSDNVWSYNDHYIRLRPDFYGWTESNGSTNDSPAWMIDNLNNSGYIWDNDDKVTEFKNNIDGATVDLTIKRLGNEVFIISDVTGTSFNYRHYFVMTCGDGTQNIYAFLCVDGSHIEIDNNKTTYSATETIKGTLLGLEDNKDNGLGAGAREDFTIAPNGTLNLHFKNYSNKIDKWNNWCFEMQQDDQYADVVTGGASWGALLENITVASDKITWDGSTWPAGDGDFAFMNALDGADVELSIQRIDAKVIVTAAHTAVSGEKFTIKYQFTPAKEGFADANVTFRLLTEAGHLDLLPITKTITSAGWATLSSEYALDFTGSIENLTEAYAITGNSGTTLTLEPINQVVKAEEGILLKGSGEVNIPIKGNGTAVTGNKLVGVLSNTVKDANSIYVLMDGGNGVGFYKNNNAFTVGANTAYLPAAEIGGAPSFLGFFDSETTGIETVNTKATAFGDFYDMQGRRVVKPAKGLYIMNGKKVVIK